MIRTDYQNRRALRQATVVALHFLAFIVPAAVNGAAPPAFEFVPEDQRAFVRIAEGKVHTNCGTFEMFLESAEGFSMAAASKSAVAAGLLLKSTSVRLWQDGKAVSASARGRATSVIVAEEGPQRIVLRAPFTLIASTGQTLADAQYDFVLYPEGEVFTTLRLFPRVKQRLAAAVDLRFAADTGVRFERVYDLPLLAGTDRNGPAIGLYWHEGEQPQFGVIGEEMRCILSLLPGEEANESILVRTFVVSLSGNRDELRRRCLAHVDPLRPVSLQSCSPLIEQTAEVRRLANRLSGWCYSFREGAYNLLANGPDARLEFYNESPEGRRVRIRVVGNGPVRDLESVEPPIQPDLQVASITPRLPLNAPNHLSSSFASFDMPAYETLSLRARLTPRIFLQWVDMEHTAQGSLRTYRVVSSAPAMGMAEIHVSSGGGPAGLEITSLVAPLTKPSPAIAGLSAVPLTSEDWGRFSVLQEVAILRNRPDRVALHAEYMNDRGTMKCSSQLVFRREGEPLAVHGFHTLESLENDRRIGGSRIDLPAFRLTGSPQQPATLPRHFFYANRENRLVTAPRTGRGFGYLLTDPERDLNPSYALCGFDDAISWGVLFLGRNLEGNGKLRLSESTPRLSMMQDLPGSVSKGQRFQSYWKMVIGSLPVSTRPALQETLVALNRPPVDLTLAGVTDGRLAHRLYELSPAANPLSPDGRTYLLEGGSELAIIGSGADSIRWPWLFRIRALGFAPERMTNILLCNAGARHANGSRTLKQMTGAKLRHHITGIEPMSVLGPTQDEMTGVPWDPAVAAFELASVDTPLRTSETLRIGDHTLVYNHMPGVTSDNGCYFLQTGGVSVAFTGNLLVRGEEGGVHDGADAHAGGHFDDWIASLTALQKRHVDFVFPDSGPPIEGLQQITDACNRLIEYSEKTVRAYEIDYTLPRPAIVRRHEVPAETITGRELWGVKELFHPAVWHREPIEIAPGLWQVAGGFLGEPDDANVYLLDGGSELALIGAGSGFHTRSIVERILSLGKNPMDVAYILLPSSHWYEARGAESLRAATQARVLAHRYEAGALFRGDPIRTGLKIGPYSFDAFPPLRIDREIEWGELIQVGRSSVRVLDAPGFHRGSTAYLIFLNGKRYLATGMAAVGELATPNGGTVDGTTGWIDYHWGGNLPSWTRSLQRLIELRPDGILPGQGRARTYDSINNLELTLARVQHFETNEISRTVLPGPLFEQNADPVRPDLSRLNSVGQQQIPGSP